MTEKQANKIFRTKYPEGRIYNGKSYGGASSSEMVVVFKQGGKSYNYQATTYQQILERFGFTILYKHNVENYRAELTKLKEMISKNGYVDTLAKLLGLDPWHELTKPEKIETQAKIDQIEQILAEAIIV